MLLRMADLALHAYRGAGGLRIIRGDAAAVDERPRWMPDVLRGQRTAAGHCRWLMQLCLHAGALLGCASSVGLLQPLTSVHTGCQTSVMSSAQLHPTTDG